MCRVILAYVSVVASVHPYIDLLTKLGQHLQTGPTNTVQMTCGTHPRKVNKAEKGKNSLWLIGVYAPIV